jgi:hypothetical protein
MTKESMMNLLEKFDFPVSKKILEETQMSDEIPKNMSGGEKKTFQMALLLNRDITEEIDILILDEPHKDLDEQSAIKMLKGSGTIICPYIIKKNGVSLHSRDKGVDKIAIQLLRKLADLADESGLQVAIYPHLNFYVERTDHAVWIAKKANKNNLGLTFNLCHWLATTNMDERNTLKNK